MNIFQRIGRWFAGMFQKKDIESAIGIEVAISQEMREAQELWRKIYAGQAPWNTKDIPSLNLASGICVEAARAVTIEIESNITGDARADYLQAQYSRVLDELRKSVEKCCAGGTLIFRPFVRGNDIYVTAVENNCYYPLKYNELGELISVVFIDTIIQEKKYYTLLEKCEWENGDYTISYSAYVSNDENALGREISLTSVERWANLPPSITFKDVKQPWFSIMKMPQVNHIEQNAPEGVSLFSKAIDLIREADEQFGRITWEYEAGEAAVYAPIEYFKKDVAGNPILPQGRKRQYRILDDKTGEMGLHFHNPTFRDESLFNGLDKIKRQIEFVCGLAYGTISDPQSVDRTATEIKISRQRSYSTIADIQKATQTALKRLIAIMDDIATRYYLAPQGESEVSFQWDDSIIADRETEFRERKEAQNAGWLFPAENRAWYNGTSIEQAQEEIEEYKSNIPADEFI